MVWIPCPVKLQKTPEEAVNVAKSIDSTIFVVKAQNPCGGVAEREGGVKTCTVSRWSQNRSQKNILGMQLITPQDRPWRKKQVRKSTYRAKLLKYRKSFYLRYFTWQRGPSQLTLIGEAKKGGMDIEEVRRKNFPRKRLYAPQIDPAFGTSPIFQAPWFSHTKLIN